MSNIHNSELAATKEGHTPITHLNTKDIAKVSSFSGMALAHLPPVQLKLHFNEWELLFQPN